eukprot:4248533-Pyramimonas_sp.AAC.1
MSADCCPPLLRLQAENADAKLVGTHREFSKNSSTSRSPSSTHAHAATNSRAPQKASSCQDASGDQPLRRPFGSALVQAPRP